MKKSFLFFLLTITIINHACNKESIIEGTVVSPTIVSLNKTISLYSNNTTAVVLNVDGINITVPTSVNLLKGYVSNVNSATDSMRYNSLITPSQSSTYTLKFNANSVGNVVVKFNKGDELPANFSAFVNLFLLASKKISPYTSTYSSINTTISPSPFTYAITPQFSLNSDGYVAFILSTYSASTTVNYHGWLHIIIGQNEITFDKYAYQKAVVLKAGQED
jgi:hypothetical protein